MKKGKRKMRCYRFRAEASVDYETFIQILDKRRISSFTTERQHSGICDTEIMITTDYKLEELLEHKTHISDGHVMHNTLNYANSYTGERFRDEWEPAKNIRRFTDKDSR